MDSFQNVNILAHERDGGAGGGVSLPQYGEYKMPYPRAYNEMLGCSKKIIRKVYYGPLLGRG